MDNKFAATIEAWTVGPSVVALLGLVFLLLWSGERHNKACLLWGLAHLSLALAAAVGYQFQRNAQPGLAAIAVVATAGFLVLMVGANRSLIDGTVAPRKMLWQALVLLLVISVIGFGINQVLGRMVVVLITAAVYGWSAYLFLRRFQLYAVAAAFMFKAVVFILSFLDLDHFSSYQQAGWISVTSWFASAVLGMLLVKSMVTFSHGRVVQLLEQMPDPILLRNQRGRILFSNSAYQRWAVLGFDSDELRRVTPALRAGQMYRAELMLPLADASVLPVEISISALMDFGQLLELLQLRDLRPQRQAEAERMALLRENAERYQSLYNSMRDGFASLDLAGRVMQSNAALQRMLGYSSDELVGMAYAQLTPERVRADDRARIANEVMVRGYSEQFESEYQHKDGYTFPTELQIYLERDAAGVAQGCWVIVRDITERKLHEQQLLELNASLEQRVQARTQELDAALVTLQTTQRELVRSERLASLGSMVAGVAHELNTPLGNSLLMASTLKERRNEIAGAIAAGLNKSKLLRFLEETEVGLQLIERNMQQAADLVQSFKQVVIDPSVYQRRQFFFGQLIEQVLETLGPVVQRAGVELRYVAGYNPLMDSWPAPLTQILDHLVHNAMLHGLQERPGTVWISIGPGASGWSQLRVKDQGAGIAGDELTRVFDPFFTTRMGRGSVGLGLHIVYTLVTGILGGRIDILSAPGHGTEVVIDLPLCAAGQ
ncbi:MAG: PAS domain S-box protein [Sphingomonadaceae bacterium]